MKTSLVRIPPEKAPGPSGQPLELHSSGGAHGWVLWRGPQPSGLWTFLSYLALAPWPVTLTLHKPSLHFLFSLSPAWDAEGAGLQVCSLVLSSTGRQIGSLWSAVLALRQPGGGVVAVPAHRNSASLYLGADHRFSFPADSLLTLILLVQGPYLEEQASRAELSTCHYLNLN